LGGDTLTPPILHPTRHQSIFGARHASFQNSSQIYTYAFSPRWGANGAPPNPLNGLRGQFEAGKKEEGKKGGRKKRDGKSLGKKKEGMGSINELIITCN